MNTAKKILFCFVVLLLLGAGCKTKSELNLDSLKLELALEKTALQLEWSPSIIKKKPAENNHFGNSMLIYGPYKDGGVSFKKNNLEIIEFNASFLAQEAFLSEDCFKGHGEPIKILGMSACCLNKGNEKESEVIMREKNYLFRVYDYMHANCKAQDTLEQFLKIYMTP